MDSRRSHAAPPAFEWSDTIPGPNTRARIVRTPMPMEAAAPVQRISIVFEHSMPLPMVTELDAATGWDEFESAVRRQTPQR